MNKNNSTNTPVMRQFFEIKNKYKDTLVLFRMGDFYETFCNDAIITSKVLGIVLTKRANGKAANVDLAGFPYHALDNYLPKLVKSGHRVAICEQVEDPKLSKGIVKREVVEIVTPGTLTGDQALNDKSNRFIGSIFTSKGRSGFSFLDSSTGEFYTGECETNQLNVQLLKFRPHEIIVSENAIYSKSKWYLEFQPFMSRIDNWMFDYESAKRILTEHFKTKSLKGFGCENMYLGISAAGALINHIKNNLSSNLNHIQKLSPISDEGIMGLDTYTIRNLEIFQSLSSQGVHGTLINIIDITQTSMGGRLLRYSIMNPLTDLHQLESRLNIVEDFSKKKEILKTLRKSLKNISDIERILGKISKNRSTPIDTYSIANTLEKIPFWINELSKVKSKDMEIISDLFQDSSSIVEKIKSSLNENPPINITNGEVFKTGLDEELDNLRVIFNSGKDWIKSYEKELRERLDISKLKVGFNKVYGYYIEITKRHQEKIPKSFTRKQTLVNTERYITDSLKEYEERVLNAEQKILEIEKNLFSDLCEYIIHHKTVIQVNARAIGQLDLYTSFATLSIENNYVKPTLTKEAVLIIKQGRHPVVEKLLPSTEKFIPNDIIMDAKNNQIHLLTGPNMAGKSTYLRQLGLVTLMAQIGCFVPADSARIGIVDRLFTRVGASDNLAGGESTFLVEMNEASNILNNATNQSLILLDEVGRGTSTYDGLSLAWAITEYLHNTEGVNPRTVFATHYHELTDLEDALERLENHHVQVKEFGDSIIFMRSIAKGPGDKSYGIHVAKMAGLPKKVIIRAKELLDMYISKTGNESNNIKLNARIDNEKVFQSKYLMLCKELEDIDIDLMTPIEALRFLDGLKKKYDL
ncbi:MAG: DNA mismatch repair protein MutS [Candidatus Marinimicrobia bacterium]|nr:DNA mismatch repair protein MutS [Candidatus Neomarinimicrobiota bacterium]